MKELPHFTYDIHYVPKNWSLDQVLNLAKERKVVVYDSRGQGQINAVLFFSDKEKEYTTIDFHESPEIREQLENGEIPAQGHA